jgi:nitric oxide reductase activation protein
MEQPITKENLLNQVDALRDIARRSRRLIGMLSTESDRRRLQRHADELDDSASRLETEAASAKTLAMKA